MALKIKTRLSLVTPDHLERPTSIGEMRISLGEE